ncbi:MAG: fumarylacetoacetate hydrolase family protein [Hyphomicrobiales bacterium]
MHSVIVNNAQIIPSKIICIGRNYVDHIKELNNEMPDNMTVFMKPNSAIGQTLNAEHNEPLHYEAELCFLMKDNKINAVGVGLDLTKRGLQSKLKAKGLPWERCKAFDGSALFSEFSTFSGSLTDLNFTLDIDGKNIQTGNIDLMIYKPDTIISELQEFLSFEDGDIIMTGTPAGVGMVQKGQQFVANLYNGSALLTSKAWQAV